jgi:excisionase family DNA binding protein
MACLRCGREFVYHLINHGEIETIKRGARRLVVLQSVKEYAERERRERAA